MQNEMQNIAEKCLQVCRRFVTMLIRDTFISLLLLAAGAGDQKEDKHMNKYEVTVILSAKLEEEERTAAIDRVKSYIERYNGTVGEVEEWGKKRLAYEIQHQADGFYYLINFEGDSETPNGVESELRIFEPVLRYLVVKKAD